MILNLRYTVWDFFLFCKVKSIELPKDVGVLTPSGPVVNSELKNVYDRFNANRLTINKLKPRKQNVVIFRPRQKRLLIIRHVSEF